MRRLAFSAFTVALVLSGCSGDAPLQPGKDRSGGVPQAVPGTCADYATLRADLANLFASADPNKNSALGKYDNILHQIAVGDLATAKDHTWDLVSFILKKKGGLVASSAQIAAVITNLFCIVGLDFNISNSDNVWTIFPSDAAQVLTSSTGFAGGSFQGNTVTEPTLVTIDRDLTFYPLGQGPLSTELDQWPLFFKFHSFNEGNTEFTKDVIVGVCPASGIPTEVLADLKLGHQAATGFEIPPPAAIDFLDCTGAPSVQTQSSATFRALGPVLELAQALLLPEPAHAAFITVGVGGAVKNFSDFGLIDSRLLTISGVGGSVKNFAPSIGGATCPPVEAPIGTEVPQSCRPEIKIQTHLGKLFHDVPVTFSITSGGGTLAAETASLCGPFAASVLVTTANNGTARACWTLGILPGVNTAEGRPGLGGPAIAGVTFSPVAYEFTATANPPTQLGFLTQPTSAVAGSPILPSSIQVAVQDKNGVTVAASTAAVTLALSSGAPFTSGNTVTVNAVNGIATFANLTTTVANLSVQLVATSPNLTQDVSAPFAVSPAAPAQMIKLSTDPQTVAAGATAPSPPSVKVLDMYNNAIAGLVVLFQVQQSNGSQVTGGTQTTNASGTATVGSWTVGVGFNSVIVTLQDLNYASLFTTFTANGTTTLAVINTCAQGGSGDPLSYSFYAPGSTRGIKQVELYLSSNGSANTPKTYRIALVARVNGFNNAVVGTSTVDVTLTGRTSQFLPTEFAFATPIASANNSNVAFQFQILSNPDGATLTYNSGPCGLGGSCKPPKGCSVTEVQSEQPYPLGTVRRKSVAIKIFGN